MKSDYIEKRYKMNKNTTVVVVSKRDGDVYKNKITLTHETAGLEPLLKAVNPTRSEIADKIADIDLDDDNVNLFGDTETVAQ